MIRNSWIQTPVSQSRIEICTGYEGLLTFAPVATSNGLKSPGIGRAAGWGMGSTMSSADLPIRCLSSYVKKEGLLRMPL